MEMRRAAGLLAVMLLAAVILHGADLGGYKTVSAEDLTVSETGTVQTEEPSEEKKGLSLEQLVVGGGAFVTGCLMLWLMKMPGWEHSDEMPDL